MSAYQKKAASLAMVLAFAFASSVITKPAIAAGGSRCTLDQQCGSTAEEMGSGALACLARPSSRPLPAVSAGSK